MITLDAICVQSPDVVARDIEGDLVIVPLVSGIGDADDELYTLNDTGRAIWDGLDGLRTLGEVAAVLAEQFDGDADALEADVVGFADELVRRGILSVRS